MNFQEIISKLSEYWAEQGCVIQQPYDVEVGAGTFNPATFLRVLGPEPWRVAYVEPSRRPTDGRYGDNPWRTGHYYQYQVVLKPSPPDIQDVFLQSLERLGIDLCKHDIRFVEDDWESPTLGAGGLGWEVWLDGAEITQYTYFQQMGSIDLDPISVEITYGLERIALDSQNTDSFFDIEWTKGITYGDVHYQSEVEFSKYYKDFANVSMLFELFSTYEKEALACLNNGLVLPGLDYVLKCSHTFNILDARGSISVTERAGYIARVRNLARKCAQEYCKQRQSLGYPLLRAQASDYRIKKHKSELSSPGTQQDFLLEIGTEELPSSYIKPALDQMEELIRKLFTDNGIDFGEVRTLGTPRRLTLSVTQVLTHQPDRTVEIVGPPKRTAFDEKGFPTKSAEGFARKYGMSVGDLKVKNTERGEYVYLLSLEKGKPTIELLSEELPKLISSLSFPKSMHFSSFEDGKFQFARPVRWVVALLGNDIIRFNLGRVSSDRYTYGHRFLSSGRIEIKSASLSDYLMTLKKAGVIADIEERRGSIRDQITEILKSEGCPIYIDEELLDTVTFLVEKPKAVVGTFNESYLSLPVEVLETAMKKHQRYFSLHAPQSPYGKSISLLPKFIAITNGVGDDEIVRHGNERVLRARLADAEFFYHEDQKVRLADKVVNLKHVVFQEELGSLYDKTCRLKELADFLCLCMGLDERVREDAVRAAELCKADLITQMVIEFPSLQGIMGGYYATNSGENSEVAKAISHHYYPTSPTGPLPENSAGSIVSIADKLDTIVGYFGIGIEPTGSQDPYALRRQATGILRILLEKGFNLSLEKAVEKSIDLYSQFPQRSKGFPDKVRDDVMEFLRGRISFLLSERGFAYDVIDSVLSADSTDVVRVVKRAQALSSFRKRTDFNRIYPAFNRVLRILPDRSRLKSHALLRISSPSFDLPQTNSNFSVNEELFQDFAERSLYESISSMEPDVEQSAKKEEYDKVLDRLSTLCDLIDTFFERVLVMVEDDELRNNRLAILYRLASMLFLVADFSKLVE